jgi:hypothetical protein
MPSVAEVVRRYGPEYLERFGASMPAGHKKVLRDIAACRTGELGMVVYRCADCGKTHALGRSCGNRHCPSCQRDKAEAWLEDRTDRLLPCPYFLVTFALPAELRDVARAHQRAVYAALFQASSEALRALAADPKYVGTDRLGFFGVLHTWGRTLEYHPHVHYVVPGGGLGADGTRWLPSRAEFLVPVKALSILFRAKFRDILGRVGSKRQRKMTLDAMEFLRRFLQHVLPSGFQKVRSYGFLSPAGAVALELVRWLIALCNGLTFALRSRGNEPLSAPTLGPCCPECGGPLIRLGFVPAPLPAVFDTS